MKQRKGSSSTETSLVGRQRRCVGDAGQEAVQLLSQELQNYKQQIPTIKQTKSEPKSTLHSFEKYF